MYLKTKEHRSTHPRNRYQAGKHLIVPHRRSSVVNFNSINLRNNQCLIKTYTDNVLNQRTNETHGSNSFVDWTYDGEGLPAHCGATAISGFRGLVYLVYYLVYLVY